MAPQTSEGALLRKKLAKTAVFLEDLVLLPGLVERHPELLEVQGLLEKVIGPLLDRLHGFLDRALARQDDHAPPELPAYRAQQIDP